MRLGMMCAQVVVGQRLGTSMSHVCVDRRVDPSGSNMVMGSTASRLLWMGVPSMRKWLVALELLRANVICGCGGSIVCRVDNAMSEILCQQAIESSSPVSSSSSVERIAK